MSVYVAHSGQFYVNGKVIKQELEKALREELGQRAEWTVDGSYESCSAGNSGGGAVPSQHYFRRALFD